MEEAHRSASSRKADRSHVTHLLKKMSPEMEQFLQRATTHYFDNLSRTARE